MLLSVQTRYLPCTSERENYAKYTWEMQNVRMNYEAVNTQCCDRQTGSVSVCIVERPRPIACHDWRW